MASNNEKEENMEEKIVHDEKVSEGLGSVTVTHTKEEEVVLEAKDLEEPKLTEKEEHVTEDPGDKDKTTTPSKKEIENPEVEVDIPHATEEVPSEQPAPKPADVAPLPTQQKGCCVIL